MRDPTQEIMDRANHEGRHACAAFWFNLPVTEIDVSHHTDGVAGRVTLGAVDELKIPDGIPASEVGRWFDETMSEDRLRRAIVCRVGAGPDLGVWLCGAGAASDREAVARLCPSGTDPVMWMHVIVENAAMRLLENPDFNAALRNLSAELYHSPRPPMPGARAYAIVERFLP